MSNKFILLNGQSFSPTSIQQDEDRIAEVRRAVNGTLKISHRAWKSKWSINWTNLPETYIPSIRAIYRIMGSYIFQDELSRTFTVMNIPGGLSVALSAENISLSGIIHYTVDLQIQEV